MTEFEQIMEVLPLDLALIAFVLWLILRGAFRTPVT